MKKFSDVVVKENTVEYLNIVNKKTLFIYSPTSAEKINYCVKSLHTVQNIYELGL